jgi:hypothetical protein
LAFGRVEPAGLPARHIDRAAELPMNTVIFQNNDSASIASLAISEPVAPERFCVFITTCFSAEIFRSRESEILLPGRPTEYRCRYMETDEGCEIAFENQNGWCIKVTLDQEAEGEWSAEKNGERVQGFAFGLTLNSCPA